MKTLQKLKILFAATVACLLSTQHCYAKDATASSSDSTSLYDLIVQGGWTMIPLGAVCLFTFYLVFYCFRETLKKKFIPEALLPGLAQDMHIRDLYSVDRTLAASPTVLAKVLRESLTKARPDREDCNREKVESALVEMLESEDNSVSAWINYLNVCAATSPMIGLLGTVSGMIGAFQTIGTQGMGDPSALAGDIGQALITTAAGLCIAIPAMIFYFILKNRLNARMIETAQAATTLIDYMTGDSYAASQEVAEEATEEYAEEV